jgi:hypothetical protein
MSKGSEGACTPSGIPTFLLAAFTAQLPLAPGAIRRLVRAVPAFALGALLQGAMRGTLRCGVRGRRGRPGPGRGWAGLLPTRGG